MLLCFRYLYKQDYERFKLTVSHIILGLSLLLVLTHYATDVLYLR